MPSFVPPLSQRAPRREFTIRPDARGHWIAAEAHDLTGGVFFSRQEALRFALREADDDATCVHLAPAVEPARRKRRCRKGH